MTDYNDGLSALRYPRDLIKTLEGDCPKFVLGKAHQLRKTATPKLAILGYGATTLDALVAADRVDADAIDVYDARFAKPVDGELIEQLLSNSIPIITVEDHSIIGGFGAAILEEAARRNLDTTYITTLGLPDRWIGHGSRKEQLAEAGIDATGIAAIASRILSSSEIEAPFVVTK
jgi:1-deoxy-D-xylulose-5-phosphate synthase